MNDRTEIEEMNALCELLIQDVRAAQRRIRELERERDAALATSDTTLAVADAVLRQRQRELAAWTEFVEHVCALGLHGDARTKKLLDNVQLSMRGS